VSTECAQPAHPKRRTWTATGDTSCPPGTNHAAPSAQDTKATETSAGVPLNAAPDVAKIWDDDSSSSGHVSGERQRDRTHSTESMKLTEQVGATARGRVDMDDLPPAADTPHRSISPAGKSVI